MKNIIMKKLILLLVFCSTVCFAQLRNIVTTTGTRAKLYLPLEYDSTKKYPLMVFLHGIGERGTNIEWVLRNGTPYWISKGHNFPFIVVAPQLEPTKAYTNVWIDGVLEYVSARYKVNRCAVWLVGFSFGGMGVMGYVQDPVYQKKASAFVSIAGGGNDPTKANIIVNGGIEGWMFHSTNDTVVPYTMTTRMFEAVNLLAGKEQIKLTTYAAGHIIANKATNPIENKAFYEWLATHVKPGAEEIVVEIKVKDGMLKVKTPTNEYSIPLEH
jgi:predicted peptidase